MPEVRNRQNNPSPSIEYMELYLPHEKDFSTGVFTVLVKRGAMGARGGEQSITAITGNRPSFKIEVHIDVARQSVAVNLGRDDGTNPLSAPTFVLPGKVKIMRRHEFEVRFTKWQVNEVLLDGKSLPLDPASAARFN